MQTGRRHAKSGGGLDWEHRSLVEEIGKQAQLVVPLGPLGLGGEQIIANVAQELDLHDVDLMHRDARDLSPRLIGVSVIVKNYRESAK